MSDSHYLTLAEIVAFLGERGLAEAFTSGRLRLRGYLHEGMTVAKRRTFVEEDALEDWEPDEAGAVRFNLETNSIEANAHIDDFASFDRHADRGWGDVHAKAHEVYALAVEMEEPCPSPAIKRPDSKAKAAMAEMPGAVPASVSPRRRGRPPGSGGYVASDAPFVDKMHCLREANHDMSIAAAAAEVADSVQGNSFEAKRKRLTNRYKEKYGAEFH